MVFPPRFPFFLSATREWLLLGGLHACQSQPFCYNDLGRKMDCFIRVSAISKLREGQFANRPDWRIISSCCHSLKLKNGDALVAGELGQLQRDAVKAGRLPLRETVNARMNAAADDRGRLESNMAGSLALGNAAEYRRWLMTYVRHLAGTKAWCPLAALTWQCPGFRDPPPSLLKPAVLI